MTRIGGTTNPQTGFSTIEEPGSEITADKAGAAAENAAKSTQTPESQGGSQKPEVNGGGGMQRPIAGLQEKMTQKALFNQVPERRQNRSEIAEHPAKRRVVADASGDAKSAPSFTVKKEKGRPVIEGTSKDDIIKIDQKQNGDLIVSDEKGRSVTIPKDDLNFGLVVRTGDGADQITATDRVTHKLVIYAGDGDDKIQGGSGNDEIFAGDGKNVVNGGKGDDYIEGGNQKDIIDGGEGNDVIYGMGGDDELQGGKGRDYIDGGEGDDHISGGADDDMLIGGKGNDTLEGGEGKDVLAGGSGRDTYDGGKGADVIYRQADDSAKLNKDEGDREEIVKINPDAGKSIKINGDKRFQERVKSDFEAWRSLPKVGDLLTELDERNAKAGRKVTITEEKDFYKASEARSDDRSAMRGTDNKRGTGGDVEVKYNTTDRKLGTNKPWDFIPPSVEIYHEMSHTHDMVNGDLPLVDENHGIGITDDVYNKELKATGLPFDHDADPNTPMEQPGPYNENLIRQKLGLPTRDDYKTDK